MRKQFTTRAADLYNIVDEDGRGVFSIVSESGNLSEITAAPVHSQTVPGSLVMETEHGVLYLPEDKNIIISEWLPETLGADVYRDSPNWRVSWDIQETHAHTPREACWKIWKAIFGRSQAGAEDACIFRVTDMTTRETVTIDLSDAPAPEAAEEDIEAVHG